MNVHAAAKPATDLTTDLLVVAVTADLDADLAALDKRFGGKLIALCRSRKFTGKPGSTLLIPGLGQIESESLLLVGAGSRTSDALTAIARAGREARTLGARVVAVDISPLQAHGLSLDDQQIVEHVYIGNYQYDAYKPEDDRRAAVEDLHLVGAAVTQAGVGAAKSRAKWQSWARDLVNMPPADLYPESLAEQAQRLAKLPGVTVTVWNLEKCRQEGLVGIVAVGQGSPRPGLLIHASYKPSQPKKRVALIGKGVTFDTGGLSLKPSDAMQTMRCDMGGAATVLGAFGAAAELGEPVAIDCFVAAVENMNDGNAYKLGDILRYRNGVTVEIHNTDAEGRLVLADALLVASEIDGLDHIVDAATLTGACVVALGNDFTALFTNDEPLAAALHTAAGAEGEGLWRLPLHAPYKEKLRGEWGQIKNVGGREAGSTTAALFLEHFVPEGASWAHLDIAGSAFYDRATGGYLAGGTGQMVRSLARWIHGLGA